MSQVSGWSVQSYAVRPQKRKEDILVVSEKARVSPNTKAKPLTRRLTLKSSIHFIKENHKEIKHRLRGYLAHLRKRFVSSVCNNESETGQIIQLKNAQKQ